MRFRAIRLISALALGLLAAPLPAEAQQAGWRAATRLRFIGPMSTLALGLLVASWPAAAQQPEKLYRIGYLSFGSASKSKAVRCRFDSEERECAPTSSRHIAFRQRLRELGYVAGQNYVIEYRSAQGNRKRLPDLAAELVKLKVDVIVAGGLAMRSLKSVTHIPIVFATSADLIAASLRLALDGQKLERGIVQLDISQVTQPVGTVRSGPAVGACGACN